MLDTQKKILNLIYNIYLMHKTSIIFKHRLYKI